MRLGAFSSLTGTWHATLHVRLKYLYPCLSPRDTRHFSFTVQGHLVCTQRLFLGCHKTTPPPCFAILDSVRIKIP